MVRKARRPFGEENEALRARLRELEDMLRAIRSGEVDALVMETAGEDRVFTLTSADQTYRLMVEEMQQGAATLSDDGIVLYCNPFLAALLGVPVEAMLGGALTPFLAESPASLAGLLEAAERGISRGEVAFRTGRGSVTTQVSLTRLPLERAHVFCMIVTDLTERRSQEEERAQQQRERAAREAAEEAGRIALQEVERRKGIEESLRRAEKEKTALLEGERQARIEAEEANRSKDEFLATLSHELRSPLNAIVSWSHILCEPGLDPATARRAVQVIDRNARAQAQLIGDILDVSRIVTGKFQLSLASVRLSEVIEAAVDTGRAAARARSITLHLALDPEVGPVLGDESRLQQVVWNLLSNALRFASPGGRVEVSLSDDGSSIEMSVRDDGPGIEPAFLPYVFDRFRQADSSSTRQHSGLGLGLAIVRHLVALHGGTVEARNRGDRSGALFVVRLPRQPGASLGRTWTEQSSVGPEGEPGAPPSLREWCVLVVDDDEDTREAMAIGLGRHGARVLKASSAGEALDLLVRERPHVLVADVGREGDDGYAALRRVRALPAAQGGATPAIALTGHANQQDRVKALRAGFQMLVAKPARPNEVAAAVAILVATPLDLPMSHEGHQ